jgi:hypothetical protein
MVFQEFVEPAHGIALSARRLDGGSLDGGYRHGEVRFSVPLAARHAVYSTVSLDEALLSAIERAGATSVTTRRLRTALPLLLVVVADSPLLTPLQTAIRKTCAKG